VNLPPFKVAPYWVDTGDGSFDMLRVFCPRKGCEREFWVARIWSLIQYVPGRSDDPDARVVGRPCPYCSRAAAIPEPFQIDPRRAKAAHKPKPNRRIVRRRRKS
jgi:hypothetical protein